MKNVKRTAQIIKETSSKVAFVDFLLKENLRELSSFDVEVLVALHSAPEEIMQSRQVEKLLSERLLDVQCIMALKRLNVSMKWLSEAMIKAKNYESLTKTFLFASYVKKGLYLEEVFAYAQNYVVQNEVKNIVAEILEDEYGQRLYPCSAVDIFYKDQKSFLLDKRYCAPFVDEGNFQPLVHKGYCIEILTAAAYNSEAPCRFLHQNGKLSFILGVIKASVDYYFEGDEVPKTGCNLNAALIDAYINKEKTDKSCPDGILDSRAFKGAVSYLISVGICNL